MSFLDTHSSGFIKPQPGHNTPEGLKPQDPNLPKPGMLASNRENIPQKATIATMMMGNKPGLAQSSGKTNASFHAQSSGRTDDFNDDDSVIPHSRFLTRHTALPWQSQPNPQDYPAFSTLNFMS